MTHATLSPSAQALVCMPARRKIMRFFITLAVLLGAAAASARTFAVHPGGSIQTAVNGASAGDRIVVHPGTYVETASADIALTITRDGIELVGLSTHGHPVILQNAGNQSYGVWASPVNSLPTTPPGDDENPPCDHQETAAVLRSEERRVGKECRSRWSPYH